MQFKPGNLKMEVTFSSFSFSISTFLIILSISIIAFFVRRRLNQRAEEKEEAAEKEIPENSIAILYVKGMILNNKEGLPSPIHPPGVTFGDNIYKKLIALSEDDRVVGCIAIFNTGGGLLPGSLQIANGIEHFRNSGKRIYALIDGLSCSGGVMGMAPAERIFSREGSFTGSIGVAGPTIPQYNQITSMGSGGLLGGDSVEANITISSLYAGKGKLFGSPHQDNTKHELSCDNFRGILDRSYEMFTKFVAKKRSIKQSDIMDFGAHVMDNHQALELGLIDSISNLAEIKEEILQACNLDESESNFHEVKHSSWKKDTFSGLFSKLLYGTFPTLETKWVLSHLNKQMVHVTSPLTLK